MTKKSVDIGSDALSVLLGGKSDNAQENASAKKTAKQVNSKPVSGKPERFEVFLNSDQATKLRLMCNIEGLKIKEKMNQIYSDYIDNVSTQSLLSDMSKKLNHE